MRLADADGLGRHLDSAGFKGCKCGISRYVDDAYSAFLGDQANIRVSPVHRRHGCSKNNLSFLSVIRVEMIALAEMRNALAAFVVGFIGVEMVAAYQIDRLGAHPHGDLEIRYRHGAAGKETCCWRKAIAAPQVFLNTFLVA